MSSLEKHLSGTAIQVKSPEFIVGRLSKSRREVDVSLRTKIGSSEVLVVVECRDRDNTQDVTWIEQLAGKREDVGADKAVAVSAIGFTEGARNMAAAKGIPLRTMRQIDLSEVLLWFPFQEMVQDGLAWELHDVSIAVDPSALESMSSVTETIFDVPFRSKRDGTWALLWQHLWNDLPGPRLYEGIPTDGTRVRCLIDLRFPDENLRYQIESPAGLIDVMQVTIDADLWIARKTIPLARVQSYADGERTLARDAQFHVDHEHGRLVVSLSEYPDKGTQSASVWGAGAPDVSTFVEFDISKRDGNSDTRVVRVVMRPQT